MALESCEFRAQAFLHLPGYFRLEAAVIPTFNTTARLVNHKEIQMRTNGGNSVCKGRVGWRREASLNSDYMTSLY